MPLQHINVSPIEANKGNEHIFEQMYTRSSKGQLGCGRSESQVSSQSSNSSNVEICRICHCEGDNEAGLIAPCYCAGSLRYVHQVCLQQWIKSSNIRCCELCKFQFIMHTKTKPFTEWEPLEMTGFERRKLLCAVLFHAIALACVVWSLYVLIDRTAEEIKHGLLEWPFWTKLIVVAIGFTGGVVFMYIQCKAYMQICQRWKAFNRVIYVQNAPEKQPLPSSSVTLGVSEVHHSGSHEGIAAEPGARPVESKVPPTSGTNKEETSIDLKGVRNLHIFFNQNEGSVGDGDEGDSGTSEPNPTPHRPDETTWHIKIGKGSCSDSAPSSSLRCNELEGIVVPNDNGEQTLTVKPNEDYAVARCNGDTISTDSVLKLQIKKAEIVIKFGQKSSPAGGSTLPAVEAGVNTSVAEEVDHKKDTSVNIKIDDKESEPIVIDLVQKAPAVEAGDPVQIHFDFSPNNHSQTVAPAGDPSQVSPETSYQPPLPAHSPDTRTPSYEPPRDAILSPPPPYATNSDHDRSFDSDDSMPGASTKLLSHSHHSETDSD